MGSKSYSKGISWIDDCRIPHNEEIMVAIDYQETKQSDNGWNTRNRILEPSNRGRFPANLLVSDDMLNDGNIIQYNKNRTDNGTYLGGHRKEYVGTDDNDVVKQIKGQFFNDKGSNSRYYDIDHWFNNLIDV
jgi:hypothetical protein